MIMMEFTVTELILHQGLNLFQYREAVLISDKIFDDIKNHTSLPAEFLGEFKLKNVKTLGKYLCFIEYGIKYSNTVSS